MEAIRKVVRADQLASIIDLPWKRGDMRVEVIVLPLDEAVPAPSVGHKSLKGSLKKYADPALLDKEQDAWEAQAAAKHGTL